MFKSALLTKLDVLVYWVGWTQFESVSLHCLSSDHPPPAFSLSNSWQSPAFTAVPGAISLWAQTATLLELLPSQCQSFHTHPQNRVFCQCHFCPTAILFFSLLAKGVRILPVEGVAWSRHLGEEWALYRPPMLQSCDCSWRWHTVQQLKSDSLFYRGTSQFLPHWQWS